MKHLKAFENFNTINYGDEPELPSGDDVTETELPSGDDSNGGEESCSSCNCTECECKNSNDTNNNVWNDQTGSHVDNFNNFSEKKKEGKTPKNEKEKELAKKYGDPKKITRGDFIAAAIDNKKKGSKKEDDSKASDKQKKKLPAALLKAIEAKKKK